MTRRSPAQRFWTTLAQVPADRPFHVTPDARMSYAALRAEIGTFCGLFDLAEATPGQILVAVTEDDRTIASLFLAALLDGLVPVILSPSAGDGRIAAILSRTEPVLLFADAAKATAVWAAGAVLIGAGAAREAEEDLGQTALDEVRAIAPPRPPRLGAGAEDLGYLLFTSGTTGTPKGAKISHGALAAQLEDIARVLQIDGTARLGNALVPYHTDGLIQGPVLAAWTGATLLRPPRFDLKRLDRDLDFLAREGVTHVISVPSVYDMLCRYAGPKAGFGPALRLLLSTAAPLHPALWSQLEQRFGAPVVNEYGMTETVAASHFAGPFPEMGARNSIGKPVGCAASLRGPEGQEVAPGETGELCIKGACVFQGYFGDPQQTAERLTEGWLRTGDLARLDDAGSYHIVGRVGTAINAGGFLILPEEIDEALLRAPGVSDAKTIGLPHAEFGAVPVSVVVHRPETPVEALIAHCRATLEHWKIPRAIVSAEAIPRTPSGKADIAAVKALAAASVQAPPERTGDLVADATALIEDVFHMAPGSARPDMSAEDIPGWDSYAHTALILELEDRFNLRLGAAEVQEIATIADILSLVTAKTAQGA